MVLVYVALAGLALIILVVVMLMANASSTNTLATVPSVPTPPQFQGSPTVAGLGPTVLTMFGRDHYYQLPNGVPKGTVAWFPGCARGVRGFWPHNPNHPVMKGCYGFPEDMSHTKQCLRKGYAILVQTPTEPSLCWTTKTSSDEAVKVIRAFQSKHGLESKPLFVAGASSGGSFATRVARSIKVNGLVIQVSTNNTAPSAQMPPTVWIVMERDTSSRDAAAKYVGQLRARGKPAGMLVAPTRQISPEYFATQLPSITPSQSQQIATVLRGVGLIDNAGNFKSDPKLAESGRGPAWPSELVKKLPWLNSNPGTRVGRISISPIWQVLTGAYARHEHSAMYFTACLEWLESGGRGDLAALARSKAVTSPASFQV